MKEFLLRLLLALALFWLIIPLLVLAIAAIYSFIRLDITAIPLIFQGLFQMIKDNFSGENIRKFLVLYVMLCIAGTLLTYSGDGE